MKLTGLESLLDLDGQILVQEDGSWIKIEARLVTKNQHRPHGLKYSLTLHARDGRRLMGYDNAHGLNDKGNQHIAERLLFDHKHPYKRSKAQLYKFSSPEELLTDFFLEVDQLLKEINK